MFLSNAGLFVLKIPKMLISNGCSHVINVKRELHVDNVEEYYIVS